MINWKKIEELAKNRFQVNCFRKGQKELIGAALARRNSIGILPTGGGKSLCYQLPAQVLPRITIVVSPLISLMQDQTEKMEERGLVAAKLNSFCTDRENRETVEHIVDGESRLVYVTPERLEKHEYLKAFRERGVSLLVVDEAHCVSQWGHDFRPAFLSIRDAIDKLGNPPIMALTATATPEVLNDILKQLRITDPVVVDHGMDRPNLNFEVIPTVNDEKKRNKLIELLKSQQGTGIVYTATVRTADMLRGYLLTQGILAARYHGQLRKKEREKIQQQFMDDYYKVVIATKAFGLGIDKPNVRFVIHYHFPDSLESYYQEAGRAGRDRKPALATLFYRLEDKQIQSFFLGGKYPSRADSQKVYEHILQHAAECKAGVVLRALATVSKTKEKRLKVIVAQLEQAGIVERGRTIKLKKTFSSPEELNAHLDEYEIRHQDDRERLEKMMHYAQSTQCRVQIIRTYFGYEPGKICGNCDNCFVEASRSHPIKSVDRVIA